MLEVPVPEAAWHERSLTLLKAVLQHFLVRTRRDAVLYGNLAIRVYRDRPRVGFDPDIMIVAPAPPRAEELSSLRLWQAEHVPPAFVIEVVSPGHPYKDYSETPDQCAAIGVEELVVFDPMLVGPKVAGGPRRLQVWRRTEAGAFTRLHAGDGPFRSAWLGGWLVPTEEGRRLRIADDEAGLHLWPTADEAERIAREAERAAREAELEQERNEKEMALARIAELERELARRGGGE
jgi:Uma2 family endonuclease